MSRRSKRGKAKQSLNPLPIIIGAVIALIAVVAILFVTSKGAPSAPQLDHNSYNRASSQHQGSTVNVSGTILSSQPFQDSYTLLNIEPEGGSKDGKPLGVIVSDEVRDLHNKFNLDINNSYIFTCKANKKGFLLAQTIKSK